MEQGSDWQNAADWYQEGRTLQASNGIQVYLSSFDLHLGRYYQSHSDPHLLQMALTYYKQALEESQFLYASDQVDTHIFLGEVYRSLKAEFTPANALAEFEQALALDPKSYWAETAIGHLYLYDLKDPVQADEFYRHAITKRPELPYAYYFLGESYRTQDDLGQAETYYRDALAHQPDYPPALERLKSSGANP